MAVATRIVEYAQDLARQFKVLVYQFTVLFLLFEDHVEQRLHRRMCFVKCTLCGGYDWYCTPSVFGFYCCRQLGKIQTKSADNPITELCYICYSVTRADFTWYFKSQKL